MRKILTFLLLTMTGMALQAADKFPDGTSIPSWFSNNEVPSLKSLGPEYVVTDFGVVNDSTLVQTHELQAVIDKCAQDGGGVIVIPNVSQDAIVIPQGCVMEVQDKKFVYILGKDNKVKYTEITVNPQNDGNNFIVTSGLNVGDKYVTNGITKLTDGMEIKPITPQQYQKKINDQAGSMTAGEIVKELQK